jgi:hypothetical protein
MGILKEAVIEQSSVKMAVFGPQGSSKSLTAFLIAIGLSKTFHDSAPIAMHDTEDASDWLVSIAKIEGVPFIRHKSTAFVDMVAVLREAEREGACAYLQDVVSRTWKEIQSSYMEQKGIKRLEFQHWNEIKDKWQRQYVDRYLASPLHCLVLGRLGYEYDSVEDDAGKRSQERVGTKLKAEGEFGYEPHLLIEMEARRVIPPIEEGEGRKKKRRVRKQGGQFEYYAHILKDRSRALNATSIRLPDINNYKAGDYQKIFDLFAPHWAQMNIGGKHVGLDVDRSSGSLFDSPNGDPTQRRGHRVKVALEDIEGILTDIWRSTTKEDKQGKRDAIYALFGTYSWTAVESKPVDTLESAVAVLKLFQQAFREAKRDPVDVDGAIGLLNICKDRVAAEQPQPFQPQIGVVAPEEAAVI